MAHEGSANVLQLVLLKVLQSTVCETISWAEEKGLLTLYTLLPWHAHTSTDVL